MANILDAHRRRVKPPICDLVDALREIHESKTAPDTRAVPHWPGLSGAGLHFPTFFSRLALESLTRGSEDLFRFLTPAPNSASGVSPNEARRYDALRGRLEQMEREARRHADAVDRLLERDEPSVRAATRPTPYQETLYLQCMSSGRSAGRFRCINRRGQPTSVSSVLRPFTMNGAPFAAAPALTLRPGVFSLDAGQTQIIVVEVDLVPCSNLSAGTLQTSIDLLMNEAVSLKIWVEIDVYDGT